MNEPSTVVGRRFFERRQLIEEAEVSPIPPQFPEGTRQSVRVIHRDIERDLTEQEFREWE